jgi:hypothetical protein
MILSELFELHSKFCLHEDLGKGWKYKRISIFEFMIYYKNEIGGIRVNMIIDRFEEDTFEVYRIFNHNIERCVYKGSGEVSLDCLHYGVSDRLKYVLGY